MQNTTMTSEQEKTSQGTSPNAWPAMPAPYQMAPGSSKFLSVGDPKQMSWGEKVFNGTVYTGLNYFVNLGISIGAADYFINGGGKKTLDSAIDATAKLVTKTGLAADKSHRYTKTVLSTLTLLSGGWALLVPLKVAEDNKRPIVHWINKISGVQQVDEKGQELTSQQIHIEEEVPHQSWPNVLWRRTLATAAVTLGAGPAIEYTVGQRNAEKFITGKVNKVLNSGFVPYGKTLAESGRAQRYINFAALDAFYTGITAVIMKMTNGGKAEHEPGEVEPGKAAHQASAPAPSFMPLAQPYQPPQPLFTQRVGKSHRQDIQSMQGGYAHQAKQANASSEYSLGA